MTLKERKIQNVPRALVNWCYHWLPVIMGCHCRPDRSFFIKGKQMPVCARCEGELLGVFLSLILIFVGSPPLKILFFMLLPMIADGSLQAITEYESTNPRRLITGTVFGYALATLILLSFSTTFRWGIQLGENIIGKY